MWGEETRALEGLKVSCGRPQLRLGTQLTLRIALSPPREWGEFPQARLTPRSPPCRYTPAVLCGHVMVSFE